MSAAAGGVFRSFKNSYNYRVWACGALVSNIGGWMQRIAQDWLVLTELTHRDARQLGLVVALQFAPQILFLPWTGWAADHMDRRKLLFATQISMGVLAALLGVLTLTHQVRVWHVDVFAFFLGIAGAFDAPVRNTFVADMVGEDDLSNAVALNATSFNLSRTVGPALAGLSIAAIGTGWVFMFNALSFVAVIISLMMMRTADLHSRDRPRRGSNFIAALEYVRGRPDLITLMVMLMIFGSLGLNFPIFISTMAASVFHVGASGFGLLTSAMAIGSVCGALLAARRDRPRLGMITAAAVVFGVGYTVAAVMPTYLLFAMSLTVIGIASQTVTTSTSALVQLSTEPAMRGRVMALLLTIALGGQLVGAPFVGWVAHTFGPRWGLGVGAASGLATAAVGAAYILRRRKDEAAA